VRFDKYVVKNDHSKSHLHGIVHGKLCMSNVATNKMKTPLAIIMFGAISCYATETNSITSEIHEYNDKDGRVVSSCEQFYRGKDTVMMTISGINSQGQLVVRSRCYFVHGDMMMTEVAVGKEDKTDTITIWRPGSDDIEVYRRKSDGSVSPASAELLQAIAAQNSAYKKFGAEDMSDSKKHAQLEELAQRVVAALKSSDEVK